MIGDLFTVAVLSSFGVLSFSFTCIGMVCMWPAAFLIGITLGGPGRLEGHVSQPARPVGPPFSVIL